MIESSPIEYLRAENRVVSLLYNLKCKVEIGMFGWSGGKWL